MNIFSYISAFQHYKFPNELVPSELKKETILQQHYPIVKKQIILLRCRYIAITVSLSILFCIFVPILIYLLLHMEWSFETIIKSNVLLLLAFTLLLPFYIKKFFTYSFLISKRNISYAQYGSIYGKNKFTYHMFIHTYFVSVQFQLNGSFLPGIKCTRKQFQVMNISDNILVISFDGKKAYCFYLTKKK